MHIHTKYEVSILNPVARRAMHRCQRCQTMLTSDENYARWTNHDYIGSFGRIPNEPKKSIGGMLSFILFPNLIYKMTFVKKLLDVETGLKHVEGHTHN